ncbi:toll/interleukin-1 receptor domain-containing protein [Aliarcobacter butzleri]|uniref:toll/interleukin-1 receptor domain-containing protein n=1 Tax=Aliarcobacter butzleri TaxID=28197 RepID=UPI001EE108EF|nr:toll/interleukin-1 receptor domain-containing protein [Aliarcobacter butzleri]MCG3674315.1 toll/interleukin-1 receptor domain-containing protein [Aliarcobacter butzleri]
MEKKLVFISHITEESELAMILSEEIKKSYLGMLDTFVSSDGESLPAGGRWLDTIDAALTKSAIQVSLCSPQSIKRPWINFEAGASWIRRIPVIPVCHSGLSKSKLPIPLSMLQATDIDNEADLKTLFNELTRILGANQTPNIDYANIISKSKDFSYKYTYVGKIKSAIYAISNIVPDLNELLFSGCIQSAPVQIKDFQYNQLAEHLEVLRENDFINYSFSRTVFSGSGTFKGGNITLTNKYLAEAIYFLK